MISAERKWRTWDGIAARKNTEQALWAEIYAAAGDLPFNDPGRRLLEQGNRERNQLLEEGKEIPEGSLADQYVEWVYDVTGIDIDTSLGEYFERVLMEEGLQQVSGGKKSSYWVGGWRRGELVEGYVLETSIHNWNLLWRENRENGLSYSSERIRRGSTGTGWYSSSVRLQGTHWPDEILSMGGMRFSQSVNQSDWGLVPYYNYHRDRGRSFSVQYTHLVRMARLMSMFLNDINVQQIELIKMELRRIPTIGSLNADELELIHSLATLYHAVGSEVYYSALIDVYNTGVLLSEINYRLIETMSGWNINDDGVRMKHYRKPVSLPCPR